MLSKDQARETIAEIRAIPAILRIVRSTTRLRFCAVAHVTEDSWTACAVLDELEFGLHPGATLDVDTTLCRQVRAARTPVVIDEVATDPVYAAHRTPAIYGFQSYVSYPIVLEDGAYFGTLCGLDTEPARVPLGHVDGTMQAFASLIGMEISTSLRLRSSEQGLAVERERGRLRDRFVTILGHDIRNPLTAILMGTDLLLRKEADPRSRRLLERIGSSGRRIQDLADDVLDLARGRVTGGIPASPSLVEDLARDLDAVVGEFRLSHPGRVIEASLDIAGAVYCDARRVAQLLANLLANALTHGSADAPVTVDAGLDQGSLRIAVGNQGEPIPAERVERLFEAYQQLATGRPRSGLGLGLYIAREIARAHRGSIDVVSTPQGTVFTFRMPMRGPELAPDDAAVLAEERA